MGRLTKAAATWIDSWLQDDLGAPLLAIRARPPSASAQTAPPAGGPGARGIPQKDQSPGATSPAAASSWLAGLAYENASADDGGDWRGLRADVCKRLGPSCLGLSTRISETTGANAPGDDFARFEQSSLDAMAKVQFPVSIGQSTLLPHLALGASWLRSARIAQGDCVDIQGDGFGCEFLGLEEEAAARSSWAPRAEAGLALSVPLASSLRLHLGASLDLRPLGQRSKVVETSDPGFPEPCGDPIDEPNCTDQPTFLPILAMPSDPEQFLRLSIGLQVQL